MKKLKKLVVFDLDGTLAESKAAIETQMAELLNKLIQVAKVAIISGGDWPQFQKQVLSKLPQKQFLKNLIILPTCGAKYYQYRSGWKQLYTENFTKIEANRIIDNLQKAVAGSGLKIEKTWGEQIEDRGSQVTFSALGQQAPLNEKRKFDPDFAKRRKIKSLLEKTLPEFSVEMGGATSIDITKRGVDKAYGIYKLHQILDIKIRKTIFIGDALFEGGNDHPATTTGVACIEVKNPGETKIVIQTIIAYLNMDNKKKHESI
ncbi:HAD-IIB family hydrolase [Mucilaginibacter paludis]|uniref:phosphomannomutase n=1 Tax=Mucilaginibacter paludis DSM 18603 TaxID=714943 RepID=H1Y813_9SPHI|nr:HAD-IIB family hydrolase [Mucilaginibacter paludis]EHQ31035.1 HAD-superfamily hydrolase, subfamily IIB [Mucilaginibacter paludis DSM 18603]